MVSRLSILVSILLIAATGLRAQVPDFVRDLASPDDAVRERAAAELESRPLAEQVAILRQGLFDADEAVALGCAGRIKWYWLDDRESTRYVALTVPHSQSTLVDFEEMRSMMGERGVTMLWKSYPGEPWELFPDSAIGALHRQARPVHIPLAIELVKRPEPQLRSAAFEHLCLIMTYTDQHRDEIARLLLAVHPDVSHVGDGDQFGIQPPRTLTLPAQRDGFPPALAGVLELFFGAAEPAPQLGRWQGVAEAWLARWAEDSAVAAADAGLVLAAARRAVEPSRWERLLARHRDEASLAFLGTRVWPEGPDGEVRRREVPALLALARRGSAAAGRILTEQADQDGDALTAFLLADPTAARAWVEERVLSGDPALATRTLGALAYAVEEAEAWREPLARQTFATLAERAVAAGLDWRNAVRLAATVPGSRRLELVRFALVDPEAGELRELDADEEDVQGLRSLWPFLEVMEPALLMAALRGAARTGSESLQEAARDALLRLGDPESAELLLAHPDEEDVVLWHARLARSWSAAVARWVDERRARALVFESDAYPVLATLAVRAGVPEGAATPLVEALREAWLATDDEAAEARLTAQARAITDGRARDVLIAWYEEDPTRIPEDRIADLVDDRLPDLLRRARERRELGVYQELTGVLAEQGDPAARAELRAVIADGRYRWVDNLHARALTFGNQLDLIPFWIGELEANCCRAVVARRVLEDVLGLEDLTRFGDARGPTQAAQARAFWDRCAKDLRWSRLAGRYVRGED